MLINCAEFEILLCDKVDGTLQGRAQEAFEMHRGQCEMCHHYAADVLETASFLQSVPVIEPPKELLTRILFETPRSEEIGGTETVPAGWATRLRTVLAAVLMPRFAMGMAMTILSIAMLAHVFKLPARDLRPAELDPGQIWASVENQSYRVWSRVIKYYDNLRLVFEIQSRLKEWSEEEELERQNQLQNKTEKLLVPDSTDTAEAQKKQ